VVAYVDSSVALRYLLSGGVEIHHALEFPRVISSELLEIECRRVFQRCRLQGLLDDVGMVEATGRLEELLAGIDLFELTRAIKLRAMESFPVVVKTLDALHLATALLMEASGDDETVYLFSLDRQMNLCAQAVGLRAALA
jgi:hypothetical protein